MGMLVIKGMNMPENCKECRIDGRECQLWRAFDKWRTQRAPDCPIFYIPDHGDLIDSTEYREEFVTAVYDLCDDDLDNNRANAIIDLFDNAPVIIPAG